MKILNSQRVLLLVSACVTFSVTNAGKTPVAVCIPTRIPSFGTESHITITVEMKLFHDPSIVVFDSHQAYLLLDCRSIDYIF